MARAHVILDVRDRATFGPRVATAIYERLSTEITVMRRAIEQDVTARIEAVAAARAPVPVPTGPRDPIALLQDVKTLDVLSRRMRSLAHEERFRLGRLR